MRFKSFVAACMQQRAFYNANFDGRSLLRISQCSVLVDKIKRNICKKSMLKVSWLRRTDERTDTTDCITLSVNAAGKISYETVLSQFTDSNWGVWWLICMTALSANRIPNSRWRVDQRSHHISKASLHHTWWSIRVIKLATVWDINEQEALLLQTDRATRYISRNLVSCRMTL